MRTQQEVKSLEIFSEILDIVESTDNRRSVLPQIEELYKKIIREYPETPLAQESYLRLITIYVDEYSPPDFSKAETLYRDFLEKYPASVLQNKVENVLANAYAAHDDWQSLIKLSAPAYKEYLEKGTSSRASLLFMYAEANYNLSNYIEAERGYEIVSQLFPQLNVGKKAKSILTEMKENQR
ncbi:MAG: hypothetical protein C4538_12100 [Nitrospiraceae bacterium]|nr:MAG: hypothetical protein C4538_12100 [Nitrospiraceae bacterium]